MREFLAETLVRHGHQVCGVCATGEELLTTIRERDPELVITDIKMPQIDGIEVSNIANRDRCLPFLLVSGRIDDRADAGTGRRRVTSSAT